MLPVSQDNRLQSAIDSLFIEALRQGQTQWFRVSSGSMHPLLKVGDAIFIEPARKIGIGEIAAFETEEGLVVHRIVDIQVKDGNVRLLQLPDVNLQASWISESAIVGRVIAIRRGRRQIDLSHPLARWFGKVTSHIRYRLYLERETTLLRLALRASSRLLLVVGNRCIEYGSRTATAPEFPGLEERYRV
ncbi:MAG TPA: S26 family signal peptidase [Ktedonobacteraceae bacterium]|nr:S26 family signal peptidase [Ktedonobacteraceae bacterium]